MSGESETFNVSTWLLYLARISVNNRILNAESSQVERSWPWNGLDGPSHNFSKHVTNSARPQVSCCCYLSASWEKILCCSTMCMKGRWAEAIYVWQCQAPQSLSPQHSIDDGHAWFRAECVWRNTSLFMPSQIMPPFSMVECLEPASDTNTNLMGLRWIQASLVEMAACGWNQCHWMHFLKWYPLPWDFACGSTPLCTVGQVMSTNHKASEVKLHIY